MLRLSAGLRVGPDGLRIHGCGTAVVADDPECEAHHFLPRLAVAALLAAHLGDEAGLGGADTLAARSLATVKQEIVEWDTRLRRDVLHHRLDRAGVVSEIRGRECAELGVGRLAHDEAVVPHFKGGRERVVGIIDIEFEAGRVTLRVCRELGRHEHVEAEFVNAILQAGDFGEFALAGPKDAGVVSEFDYRHNSERVRHTRIAGALNPVHDVSGRKVRVILALAAKLQDLIGQIQSRVEVPIVFQPALPRGETDATVTRGISNDDLRSRLDSDLRSACVIPTPDSDESRAGDEAFAVGELAFEVETVRLPDAPGIGVG